ncbi:cohesin-associated protein Pds5 [Artomyces pyxidatus]|uniref:Cohesin-associated protein Pds5 n=1 Tax=Artomyces pyxidatus TaxID=48021 RepID=A0ACB8TA80_9AGAM|nr:cohesin-associated protein Pds5 [Artomyces pyxidatus]
MVAQTRAGGTSSPRKLKFHEKLVGKGLSTDTLLKKLKNLHTELAELDQDLVDVTSLALARKELIHTTILLHKDRGVKAYAACCLADLLRLYAPDAPYTHNELRDIFQFFFRQLSTGLKGSDSSYYNEYFHLLESLSTVKSVVLVCDLPNAEELMVDIFRDFFNLVRHDLAKKIEIFMADILVALIDECQVLPSDALETVMAQFMDKNLGMDNSAYRLAVQVCNSTADKLQRHVCQYFTDIIVQHSADEEFNDIRNAHNLIKQINRSCPALLHNVIPQLEEELRVEDVQLRSLATQVLGEMFADKGGADLVRKYPTTWNVWLLRKNDKSPAVRLTLVEAAKGLIANLPEQRESVEEAMQAKLLDPDEKVRAAVCKLYSQLDYEAALHHVSQQQLRNVAGRSLDKKNSVRVEALNSIGKLYSLAYPEIENGDPAAVQQFAWIPESLLHMSASTQEVKAAVEPVLAEYVFPLPSTSSKGDVDEVAWTDKLLTTMKFLDEKAINTLLGTSSIKATRPTGYERFIDCCVENNGGIIDENEDEIVRKLKFVTQKLAATFPDPQKASDDLNAFAKLNEGRLYKLLKTCMDPQTDLKTLIKSSNEFMRRIEQSSPGIHATLATFLRKASFRLINQSSIPTLVKRLQRGDPAGDGYGTSQAQLSANNAQAVLTTVSKHCPALYKPHVGELTKAIADEKNPRLVELCLQALAAVAKWDERLAPTDKRTAERVMRFVLDSNHRHAKFSARLLAKSKNSDETCAEVVNTISDELPDVDPEKLVAHIAVLVELSLMAPDAFEQKSETIMSFLLKQILIEPSLPDPDDMNNEIEWVDNDDLTPTMRAKILSLKVCRNRCLAHASSDSALDIATPFLKMFITLLEFGGSLKADSEDDPKVRTRMRLQAAVSLLRLAAIEKYASFVSNNFVLLAITMQDPCYQVRIEFLRKFMSIATTQKLPAHFNVIPFLTVHDPEADVKTMAKAYVSYVFRTAPPSSRVNTFEIIFVRFLHLLAHHPDFSLAQESLVDMAKYIDFYLELISSADNISLLYHISGKIKTVRDSESHGYSENLYALSELAQHIIQTRAHAHSWALQSYPGKIKLFSDILRPLPNPEAANEILKRVYLPHETMDWLKEQAKSARAAAAAENKPKPERKPAAKRKAAVPRTNGHAKRARASTRRNKYDDASSEDDEESSATDGSSDEAEERDGAQEPKSATSSADEEEPGEERPRRGARTKAKAKIKQQASRKSAKAK